MNAQSIIDTLTAARDEALATAARFSEAIAVFVGASSPVGPVGKPKPTAKAKLLRAPKKATVPEKTKKQSKAAPKATAAKKTKATESDDSPRTVKGRLPSKGVQQTYCENLKERQAEVGRLKALGYARVGPGQPIAPGTFDVRSSGDGDESVVVLLREKAEAAA